MTQPSPTKQGSAKNQEKSYRKQRKVKPSLFNGWWLDEHGKQIRRIFRSEYAELYRLHRICSMYERMDARR